MGAKCKCRKDPPSAGVPEWIVTYGDMMSLLLCFFILLAAFSELKKESEYQEAVEAVQEAFGYVGGVGVLPVDDLPLRSLIRKLEALATGQASKSRISQSDDPGMAGRHTAVKRVREGLMFTIGGFATFDRESAELNESMKQELRQIARLLDGRSNKVAVRGHADAKLLSPGSPWTDLYDLSYARAHAVMRFLVDECGIAPARVWVEARADSEPLKSRPTSADDQQVNRRVEVIMTESLVEDFHPDAHYTDPDSARGG